VDRLIPLVPGVPDDVGCMKRKRQVYSGTEPHEKLARQVIPLQEQHMRPIEVSEERTRRHLETRNDTSRRRDCGCFAGIARISFGVVKLRGHNRHFHADGNVQNVFVDRPVVPI